MRQISFVSAYYDGADCADQPAVFSLQIGNAQNGSQYSELYQMVLNIIPDNLFTPFSRSNTLQIMFVGIIIGLTMLVIGKNTQVVAELAEQLGYIVDGIMGFISKLVPVFVFGGLFNIIASSDFSSLAAGGKFFAGTLAGCILLILFHTVLTCAKMRITPLDLWKRTFSTFIIAVSTASSSAAFAENKKRVRKSWESAIAWHISAFRSGNCCILREHRCCFGLPQSAWLKGAAQRYLRYGLLWR